MLPPPNKTSVTLRPIALVPREPNVIGKLDTVKPQPSEMRSESREIYEEIGLDWVR
jgi:hypothetical protein